MGGEIIMTERIINDLPALLTVKEMAVVLGIGLNTAYQIIYKESFLVLRIAPKKIRVPRCELIRWIKSEKSKFEFSEGEER